jgi:hypothetical protein
VRRIGSDQELLSIKEGLGCKFSQKARPAISSQFRASGKNPIENGPKFVYAVLLALADASGDEGKRFGRRTP